MRLTSGLKIGDRVIFVDEVTMPKPEGICVPQYTKGRVTNVVSYHGICTIVLEDTKEEVQLHDAVGPNKGEPSVRCIVIFTDEKTQCQKPASGWGTWSSEPYYYELPDGDIESLERYGRQLQEEAKKKDKQM